MTSLAILKLATDCLLFISLLLLSFKVLGKQQSSGPNIQKLKELENSLKEVVKEADDASRNFSDELLSRKRDLEKLLSEIQASEARISKTEKSLGLTIEEAELAERNLKVMIQKSAPELKAVPDTQSVMHEKRSIIQEPIEEPAFSPQSYSKIPEPPSFSQLSAAAESRKERINKNSQLSTLIEKTIESGKIDLSSKNPDAEAIERTLRSIAKAADKSVKASKLPAHLEEALSDVEETGQSLIREDPRLGVLGGRRSSQVI